VVGESWEQELLQNGEQQCLFEDIQGEAEPGVLPELPYYADPKTDNQKLLNFQKEYRDGDESALNRMYELSKIICAKYINKIGQKNRKVRSLSRLDKEGKAENAATYIIEQLITRPYFAITQSFTGYLWLRVMHELFYYREVDKIVDFVDFDRFFKEGEIDTTLEDGVLENDDDYT
jgi:hypothetical protein